MWPSQRLASINLDSRQRKSRARRKNRRGIRPIVTLLEERTLLSQPGTWAAVAPLPTARVYLGAATGNDGTIYAVGGLVYGDGHSSEVDAYNPTTNVWTKVAPLPWAGETWAVADRGLIYAINGYHDGSGSSAVAAYNPQTNTWANMASLPTARDNFAATVDSNGIIYVMGGNGINGVTNEVDAYNPTTNSWTTIAPLPEPAAYITAASGTNGIVYIIGDDTNNGTATGASYAYHPSTNTWSPVASVPLYNSPWGLEGTDAATTGLDGTIYAFSGGWATPQVSAYNQTTNTWTQIASHLYCAYGKAATTGLDGTIYVMGGYSTNYAAVSEVDAYTPIPTTVDLTVTTLADDPATSIIGQVTLRDAITMADAGSTANQYVINFASGLQGTIDLTQALPALNNNISLEGPGSSNLTVQRDSSAAMFSVFTVNSGKTASISGITITGGNAVNGGGVDNFGTLTVSGSSFTGNSASVGGGLYNFNTATVIDSTFTDNVASGSHNGGLGGGGIYNLSILTVKDSSFVGNFANDGGGIGSTGMLTVTDSVFASNSANGEGYGGGIKNTGTATVTDSTFASNYAFGDQGRGGGIWNNSLTLTVTNSTFAGNLNLRGGSICNLSGRLTLNNTISSDNISGGYTGSNNLIGVNPLLGPLGNNGGPTQTMALLPGSPAIDAGSNALAVDANDNPLTTDERGVGFPRILGHSVDIGAYEFTPLSQTISFGAIAGQTYGTTITLSATATSGLPVNYKVMPGSVPANISGNVLTVTGVGLVDIEAYQAGNATYAAATPVDESFTAAPALLTITANNATKVYGAAIPSLSASYSEFVNGDTVASLNAPAVVTTTATTLSSVGDYATTASGVSDPNYTITYNAGTLTVNAAPLTVTATGDSMTYGGTVPTLTYTYTGLVNNDTSATFSGSLVTTATSSSSVGDYPITVGTLAATGNYTIGTYNPSILTIAKADTIITVTPYSVTYDGNVHNATGTSLSGLVINSAHINAGTYTDSWTYTDPNGNYNSQTGIITDTIAKANASINGTPYSVTYDGKAHTATGKAIGVDGVVLPSSDLNLTINSTHTNAGSYSDTWSFTDPTGNYAPETGAMTDKISPATPSFSGLIGSQSITYGTNEILVSGTLSAPPVSPGGESITVSVDGKNVSTGIASSTVSRA